MGVHGVRLTLCLLLGLGGGAAVAQTLVNGAGVAVTVQDLENDLLRAPPEMRANAYSRPEAVQSNLTNIYVRRVLAAEALRANMDQDPAVKAALELACDRVLSDARLAQIDRASQPSPQALEAYAQSTYKVDPKRYEAPEQVRIRHILIRSSEPDARATAEQLLKDLKAGADFAQLARSRSQDPGSAAKGGDLGSVPRGRMVKPFEDAAFRLNQAGELSDVVETSLGFHIIKLEEKRPAVLRPFEEVKDTLMREALAGLINTGRQNEKERILSAAQFDAAAIEAFVKSQAQKK